MFEHNVRSAWHRIRSAIFHNARLWSLSKVRKGDSLRASNAARRDVVWCLRGERSTGTALQRVTAMTHIEALNGKGVH